MAGSSPTRFTHRENRLRINYLDDHRCWKSRTKCAVANIEKIRVFEGFFVIRSIAVKMCAYRRVKPGHDEKGNHSTAAYTRSRSTARRYSRWPGPCIMNTQNSSSAGSMKKNVPAIPLQKN